MTISHHLLTERISSRIDILRFDVNVNRFFDRSCDDVVCDVENFFEFEFLRSVKHSRKIHRLIDETFASHVGQRQIASWAYWA